MGFLAIVFAPVFLLLFYFYIRDKYEKEPLQRVFLTFIIGMVMAIPIVVFEILTASLVGGEGKGIFASFKYAFFVAGSVEEFFKFLVVILTIYFSKHFNEPYDGIVYTVAASLGFATVEDLMYVIALGTLVGIFRAFTAIPAHAFFGAIMGFFIGKAKFSRIGLKITYILSGLLIAILFHGTYDFFILTGNGMIWLVFPLLILMGALSYLFTILAKQVSPFKKMP